MTSPRMLSKPDKTERAKLRKALGRLSREERLVCIWKRAGFSSQDIAKGTGQSVASVNRVFARARRKLRDALSR
jgi:DNA-directed RNA polymerase specialized sigma24 family protein